MTITKSSGSSEQFFSSSRFISAGVRMPRQVLIGIILILALLAFEIFNFDTTRFALQSLLGEIRFAGLAWATILAVAFCAIDFAGLARLFTPERGLNEPKEIWYLTGAWLLGATMNAVMTWWAVSVVLLDHELGNEVLSREQLITIVPVFVAILVWLTRILFIGAVTLAGERLLHGETSTRQVDRDRTATQQRSTNIATTPTTRSKIAEPNQRPAAVNLSNSSPPTLTQQPTRINRRPPRPVVNGKPYNTQGAVKAADRRR